MRYLTVLVLSLLLLAACAERAPELPPTPLPPGAQTGVGGAIAGLAGAMPSWAAEPRNVVMTPNEGTYGDGIIVNVQNYDYVYKNGYIFNSQRRLWERFEFQGEPVDDWLKQSGFATIPLSEEKFKAGENYAVVYACSKSGGEWDCNGNRWMLLKFDVKTPIVTKQPVENVDQYVIGTGIEPFDFLSKGGEMDNFEQIIVKRYDAKYNDAESGLLVVVHVFEFDTLADLKATTGTLFKQIINQGWKQFQGSNLALFLDEYDQRVAIWTSGKKIVYVETHTPHFASEEIITAYLKKYPSDLQRQ